MTLQSCSQEQAEISQPDEAFVQTAGQLADRMQTDLKAQLSTALTQVGPVGAIGVCQSVAPAIAQGLSEESGLMVSRISRKTRNTENAFSSELAPLYDELELTPMVDGKPAALHRQVGDRFVYMRAIPMQEQPCATCHGTDIAPEVQEAIAQSYPDDRATGFEPGELRGAFLVQTIPEHASD